MRIGRYNRSTCLHVLTGQYEVRCWYHCYHRWYLGRKWNAPAWLLACPLCQWQCCDMDCAKTLHPDTRVTWHWMIAWHCSPMTRWSLLSPWHPAQCFMSWSLCQLTTVCPLFTHLRDQSSLAFQPIRTQSHSNWPIRSLGWSSLFNIVSVWMKLISGNKSQHQIDFSLLLRLCCGLVWTNKNGTRCKPSTKDHHFLFMENPNHPLASKLPPTLSFLEFLLFQYLHRRVNTLPS